jgi:hypothetical protein
MGIGARARRREKAERSLRRKPLELCALMFVNFFLLVMNYRFIARGDYLGTVATDAVIAAAGFTLFKRMQTAETAADRIGYVLGAAAGSAFSLWVDQVLLRQ